MGESTLLTKAPISAVRSRWRNADDIHKGVMALFKRNLPGEEKERRATSNILYRIEYNPHHCEKSHILLQSDVPTIEPDLTTMSLSPLLEALDEGTRVAFRIDINPVVAVIHSNVRKAVPDDLIAPWFIEQKMEAAFASAEVRDVQCRQLRLSNRDDGAYVRIARIDGVATVGDADVLREHIRHGVGRAKAYGCGLLSVAILR